MSISRSFPSHVYRWPSPRPGTRLVSRRWRTVGLDQRSLRHRRHSSSILAAQGEIAVTRARQQCVAALHVGREKGMALQFLACVQKVNLMKTLGFGNHFIL